MTDVGHNNLKQRRMDDSCDLTTVVTLPLDECCEGIGGVYVFQQPFTLWSNKRQAFQADCWWRRIVPVCLQNGDGKASGLPPTPHCEWFISRWGRPRTLLKRLQRLRNSRCQSTRGCGRRTCEKTPSSCRSSEFRFWQPPWTSRQRLGRPQRWEERGITATWRTHLAVAPSASETKKTA